MNLPTDDLSWFRFLLPWLTLSLLFHWVAAINSVGFYHNDEHFQIAEFVYAKLGKSSFMDLPLEFRELMRPWLFPALLTVLTKTLRALGISNPFYWALSYRMFAAFLGWLSAACLSICCYSWFPDVLKDADKTVAQKKGRKKAVIATALFWCLPALHARHSSENLGGSVFFIGLSLLALSPLPRIKTSIGLFAGLLFGFAFEFRYQVGIMIGGALMWTILIARVRFFQLIPIFLGIFFSIFLGTLADYWGYGQWCFAPWNYFKFNILQNHFSIGEISPWWNYFRLTFTETWPLLGILSLISFIVAWIKNPRHILTWSLLPFFFFHCFIGHKELRFLFPMAHAAGIVFVQAWQSYLPNSLFIFKQISWFQWPYRILIGYNLIALITLISLPASMPIRFYQKLYTFKPTSSFTDNSSSFRIYYKDNTLFNYGGAMMNFYLPEHLSSTPYAQYSELMPLLIQSPEPLWIFHSRNTLPQSELTNESSVLQHWCQPEFSTLPAWLEKIPYHQTFDNVTNWTLFRCQKPLLF